MIAQNHSADCWSGAAPDRTIGFADAMNRRHPSGAGSSLGKDDRLARILAHGVSVVALLAAWVASANPAATGSADGNGNAGQIEYIDTADQIGIESAEMRIVFDRRSGCLSSLRNQATQDEYLKEHGTRGNPFRLYSDFVRPFELEDDPADIAATATDPRFCRVVSASRVERATGRGIRLVSRDAANRWETRLEVVATNASSAEWTLEVVNVGPKPAKVMVDFPFLNRIWPGKSRRKNLATVLDQAGYVGLAQDCKGGIYGNGHEWSMQWHAVFDPDSGGALGLIIQDPDVRNKRLWAGSALLRVTSFPAQDLQPGQSLVLPPVLIRIYRGDWRPVAQEYRNWFAKAFAPPALPEWFRHSDGWTGEWFGKRGGALMPGAVPMDSFRDLWQAYLLNPVDNHEFAFHDRGCQFPVSTTPGGAPSYIHTTGDNVLREDLGGPQALREGVARVHELGFHFTFYVEGYIVHETSALAKDGRARRWSIMNKNGSITGNYTDHGFYHICPACVEWQDHLATRCGQLVSETGADGVRLDSLGFYYLPCYNPAHKHPHPFVYNDGIRQLLTKVSRAVREANPEAVLTTEAPVDFYAPYTQGAIMSFCPREIPLMRVALPNYRPFVYGPLGPVWGSLSGFVGGTGKGEHVWRCARFPVEETVLEGEVEQHPAATPPGVVCRLFRGPDHWALVGARVDSDKPWLFPTGLNDEPVLGLDEHPGPVHVRIPGLAPQVESAVEFDIETLKAQPIAIGHGGTSRAPAMETTTNDLLLTLDSRWFVVVLRKSSCRPIVTFNEPPVVRPGQKLRLDFQLVAAPNNTVREATATLRAAGLKVNREVRIPSEVILDIPADCRPGIFPVILDGPGVLGCKRFVEITTP